MFYTYAHTRNDTGKIFYIGKGSAGRAFDVRRRGAWWNSVVAKAGLTPKILAVWPTEAEAFEHEKFLIACFRDMGADLCNLTDGGEGGSGYKASAQECARISARLRGHSVSPETRAKISAAASTRRLSAETRAKISAAGRGRAVPPSTRAKIAAARTGTTHSPETRARMSASIRAVLARRKEMVS